MNEKKKSRKRAVRLSQDAHELLTAALYEKWRKDDDTRKLTREARADLLGVSIATADRILARKGVDRPTLTVAFKNLGLAWDECYSEFVHPESGATEQTSQQSETISKTSPNDRRPVTTNYRMILGLACVCVLLPLVGGWNSKYEEFDTVKNPFPYGSNHILNLGTENFHRGNYGLARVQVLKAIELARESRNPGDLASALRMAGDLAAAQGSFQEAKRRYDEALTLHDAFDEKRSFPALLEAIGVVETMLGNLNSARDHLKQSLDGFSMFKDQVGIAMANRGLGTVAFQSGDLASAQRYFDSSMEALKGLNKPDIEMDVCARSALILREQGRFDEARKQLQDCLDYWKGRAHPRWIATTQFQLGTVKLMAGDEKAARSLLAVSKKSFQTLGDKAGAAEASRWLDSIGQFKRLNIRSL